MNLKEAYNIVLDLAEGNVIEDEDFEAEQERQALAISIVGRHIGRDKTVKA